MHTCLFALLWLVLAGLPSACSSASEETANPWNETVVIGEWTLRTTRDRDGAGGAFEALHLGQVVLRQTGHAFVLGRQPQELDNSARPLLGPDLTRSGAPHAVFYEWSGGAHCCFTAYVVRLGQFPKILATIPGEHSAPRFVPPDDPEDAWTVEVRDWAFEYWPTSFAASPAPVVRLRWRAGQYRVIRPQPPTKPRDIEALTREIAREFGAGTDADRVPYQFYTTVLDLLYAGETTAAWLLFERAWPDDVPGKAEFREELIQRLNASVYYAAIAGVK